MALLRRLLSVFKLSVDKYLLFSTLLIFFLGFSLIRSIYRDSNIANQQIGTIKTIAEVLGTKFTPLYPVALEIINTQIQSNAINLTTKHLKGIFCLFCFLGQTYHTILILFYFLLRNIEQPQCCAPNAGD